MSALPSKEEIRKKYGISEPDFAILTELPSDEVLLKEGASLKKLGLWNGLEVWAKRTIIGGVLLAFLFIADLQNAIETYYKDGQIIYASLPTIQHYASHFSELAKDQAKGFLVYRGTPGSAEHKSWPVADLYATGTMVYPNSGQWQPPRSG